MSKQYAFFYLMKNDAESIREIIPKHIRYWEDNKPVNYSGGPFGDKSGGLIIFEADNMNSAENLAMKDPFVTEQATETRWVKEWMREQ